MQLPEGQLEGVVVVVVLLVVVVGTGGNEGTVGPRLLMLGALAELPVGLAPLVLQPVHPLKPDEHACQSLCQSGFRCAFQAVGCRSEQQQTPC